MNDILGEALSGFYLQKSKAKLWIHTAYGDKEEMPLEVYFRDHRQMSLLEKTALKNCKGSVLDVGAGAGSHSLVLQSLPQHYLKVTALDVSAKACGVMRQRGVVEVVKANFFNYKPLKKFDTLLLLMNGIGLCGSLDRVSIFLDHASSLLQEGGQIIFDSSDVSYLYNDAFPFPDKKYYGEIKYSYGYKKQLSNSFSWLYVDRHTLKKTAKAAGWTFKLITEDENGQYLARLKRV